MKIVSSVLAFFCQACPFCIIARRYPESGFALFMNKLEQHCPFCRAYKELRSKPTEKE